MIRCVVVEDEINSAERLLLLLRNFHSNQIQVLKWIKTADEAVDLLKSQALDLVFFDVEIGQATAFDVLGQLDDINFKIIFTTAHQEYAIKAIKHSALDYLLKPIDAEELRLAVDKAMEIGNKTSPNDQIKSLLSYLEAYKSPSRIGLPTLFGTEYVEVSDIIRCQADVNYTHVFLKDSRKFTLAKTLKEFETLLALQGFFRTHNSHLVNLREVRLYNKGKGGFLVLKDGSEVEVASRRKEELLRALAEI